MKLKCKEVRYNVATLIKNDPALNPEDTAFIQAHLRSCAHCFQEFNKTKKVLEFLKTLEPFHPSETIWANIESRLAQESVPDRAIIHSRRILIGWISVAAVVLVGLVIYAGIKLGKLSPQPKGLTEPVIVVSTIQQGKIRSQNQLLQINESIKLKQPIISDEDTIARLGFEHKTTGIIGRISLLGENHFCFHSPQRMKLDIGNILLEVFMLKGGDFVVETPNAQVEIKGTSLYLSVTARQTQVEVLEGVVRVFNRHGSVEVFQGESSFIREDDPPKVSKSGASFAQKFWTFGPVKTWAEPRIELTSPKEQYELGEPVTLKIKITNQTEGLWFIPFVSDSAYLLVKVTTPQGQVFYTRFTPFRGKENLPPDYVEKNGLLTFPKGTTYELEGNLKEIFNAPGVYQLRVVYGASVPETELHKVWQGLVESQPISLHLK